MSTDTALREDLAGLTVRLERRFAAIEHRLDRLAVRVGLAFDMAEAVGKDESERAEVIRSDVDRLREDVAALLGRDDRDGELSW